jgi:hypothetical protein
VTELTKRIWANSSPGEDEVEDSSDFVSFFPDFVWTLRDVTLKLEVDGLSLTADEYLENSLKLKQGKGTADWKTDRKNNRKLIFLCRCLYSDFCFCVLSCFKEVVLIYHLS